jgi:hypothetical protein
MSYECVLTNNDLPATVTITKELIKDNGGTEDVTDFGVTVNGDLNNSYTFDENGKIVLELPAGTHTTREFGSAAYDVTNGCDSFTVANGENYECTIINDDIAPKVTVEKYTQPCDPEEEFVFNITGVQEIEFSLSGDCGYYYSSEVSEISEYMSNTYMSDDTFQAGEVVITESETDGWYQGYANCYELNGEYDFFGYNMQSSEFTAEIGREYYCEFENYEYGDVTVTKFNDANNNGEWDEDELTLSEWEMVLTNECETKIIPLQYGDENSESDACVPKVTTQTTAENGETVFEGLEFGSYSLEEVMQDSWTQTVLVCHSEYDEINESSLQTTLSEEQDNEESNNFTVLPGQSASCYVGNYQEPTIITEEKDSSGGVVLGATTVSATQQNQLAATGNNALYSLFVGLLLATATFTVFPRKMTVVQ